jgi:hypothetical protein
VWKAETKLDTKNLTYMRMLGQSMEEGIDKKSKVNDCLDGLQTSCKRIEAN